MKKCYESGVDPKSAVAPRTMEEARERFFPDYKNWDLNNPRKNQAKNLQILADVDKTHQNDPYRPIQKGPLCQLKVTTFAKAK
jgi:hypothetical protein